MADPNGLFDFVQVAEEFDDVVVPVSREVLVLDRVDVLDVHEQKVCCFHEAFDFRECVAGASERDSACIDTRVNARGFCCFEEFDHKVDLRKRFAAAHGDAAVASPVGLVADGLLQQVFCGNLE